MEDNSNQTPPPVIPTASPVIPNLVRDPVPTNPNPIKPKAKFSIKAIISTIIFLLLAGSAAAGYIYREPLRKLVSKTTPAGQSTLGGANPSITPTPAKKKLLVTDLVTFDIPDGWKGENIEYPDTEEYANVSPSYRVSSPDLVYNPMAGQETPSVTITINQSPTDNTHTLEDKFEEVNKAINDPKNEPYAFGLYKTTIGGQPAYSLFQKMEGYRHYFEVVNDSRWWSITIRSTDEAQQKLHADEIDKFIESIKFVDTKTTDTSNWKTHPTKDDSWVSFEFKYPPSYINPIGGGYGGIMGSDGSIHINQSTQSFSKDGFLSAIGLDEEIETEGKVGSGQSYLIAINKTNKNVTRIWIDSGAGKNAVELLPDDSNKPFAKTYIPTLKTILSTFKFTK